MTAHESSSASGAPDVDALPALDAIAPAYDRLLEAASERLEGPIQTRIRTWEDGEYELRAYHGYGPHEQRPGTAYHHVLRYHSREGELLEALLAVDIDTTAKSLIHRERVATDGGRRPARKNGE